MEMTRRKGYTMERKKKAPRHLGPQLKAVIRRQPTVFAVYTVLRLIVLATLVSSIIRGEYESAFICLLVLGLFVLPFFIQQNFGIELPSTLEIIILLFIFASEILGELKCYFITYPHWDSMLHTTTGFLCAATGFALIDILNRNSKIKFQLSPIYVAVAAFCFSMTVGVLWEFFEFGMDRLFMMDMQKDTVVNAITSVMLDPTNSNIPVTIDGITSVTINGQELGLGGYLDIGLYDTIGDLFVNFIGAVVFSTISHYCYLLVPPFIWTISTIDGSTKKPSFIRMKSRNQYLLFLLLQQYLFAVIYLTTWFSMIYILAIWHGERYLFVDMFSSYIRYLLSFFLLANISEMLKRTKNKMLSTMPFISAYLLLLIDEQVIQSVTNRNGITIRLIFSCAFQPLGLVLLPIFLAITTLLLLQLNRTYDIF